MDRDKDQDIAKKVGEEESLQQDHEIIEANEKQGQQSGDKLKNDPKGKTEAGRKGSKSGHQQSFG